MNETGKLVDYIESNIGFIYNNFRYLFNIRDMKYFKKLVINLIQETTNDAFFGEIENYDSIFSTENLINLLIFLENNGVKKERMARILVKAPYIIMFSDKIDNIYLIFKNGNFKGYSLLKDDEYRSYLYMENVDKINCNNHVVDKMLERLSREDIKKELLRHYNSIPESLGEEFESLAKNPSLKNYYFKK